MAEVLVVLIVLDGVTVALLSELLDFADVEVLELSGFEVELCVDVLLVDVLDGVVLLSVFEV